MRWQGRPEGRLWPFGGCVHRHRTWTDVVVVGAAGRGHRRQLTADHPGICTIKYIMLVLWTCDIFYSTQIPTNLMHCTDNYYHFYEDCARGYKPLKNSRNSNRPSEPCTATLLRPAALIINLHPIPTHPPPHPTQHTHHNLHPHPHTHHTPISTPTQRSLPLCMQLN